MPEIREIDGHYDMFCPDCGDKIGTFVQLDFADEEIEYLKKKFGAKTHQELTRCFRSKLDEMIDTL